MERRLAAILATDVVGYSRLIRADEEGTLAALKALRADFIDPKLAEHNGRIVKLMGDGMLAEFPSVVDAVRAADNEVPGVPDAVARVRSYHQRTKHLPRAFRARAGIPGLGQPARPVSPRLRRPKHRVVTCTR